MKTINVIYLLCIGLEITTFDNNQLMINFTTVFINLQSKQKIIFKILHRHLFSGACKLIKKQTFKHVILLEMPTYKLLER